MIDCPNADIRDRLPDLLHERLDRETRAVVLSHVEGCAACRAELALLRELRGATPGQRVDVSAIARAIVSRTTDVRQSPRARRQFSWSDWRLAAAVTVIVLGGTSVATLYGTRRAASDGDTTRAAPVAIVSPPAVVGVGTTSGAGARRAASGRAASAAPEVTPASELSMAGGVSDLSDSDLRSLLDDIEQLDALPVTEPEPVTVRLAPLTPGRGSSE